MNAKHFLDLAQSVIKGNPLDARAQVELTAFPEARAFDLLPGADAIREHFHGRRVSLCCIINGKSGRCSEDCRFCAQSSHSRTGVRVYPLLPEDELRAGAAYAEKHGIGRYSVVTAGGRLPAREVERVATALAHAASPGGPAFCASLGTLGAKDFEVLKRAGITRYHHNLETAESFFPQICATHSFQDRVATVRAAKAAGMEVCSGGLFGLGENDGHVMELAGALAALDVDAVPVNFLIPVPGTPLSNSPGVSPLRCLKILALLRFMLPKKPILVCGGRAANLKDLHPLVFHAGASGVMTGHYLTASGRDPEDDLEMIRRLGFTVA